MKIEINVKADDLVSAINNLALALSTNYQIPTTVAPTNEGEELPVKDETVLKRKMKAETSKKKEVEKETQPEEPQDDESEETKPSVTMIELRGKVASIAKQGKSKEIKALLGEFGVSKLSDLDMGAFDDFLEQVEAL